MDPTQAEVIFWKEVPRQRGRPWKNESELAMVRDWFYPEYAAFDPYEAAEDHSPQLAIEQVRLYLSQDRKTPQALLATAYVTEALMHDQQPQRSTYITDGAMMSIYAMAFTKFVNGFVDRDVAKSTIKELAIEGEDTGSENDSEDEKAVVTQAPSRQLNGKVVVKGRGESSMYAYAAKIGMPEEFVDLRHQIVHGEIPKLQVLRRRAEQAKEWLRIRWWNVHATGDAASALRARKREQAEGQLADLASRTEIEAQIEGTDEDNEDVTISHLPKRPWY